MLGASAAWRGAGPPGQDSGAERCKDHHTAAKVTKLVTICLRV